MMGEMWTIKNELSLTAFCANVKKLYEEHQYITYAKPRIGADRSLSQNSLFHVWCCEFKAYRKNISTKAVTKEDMASIKRDVKALYYSHSHADFMVHTITSEFGRGSRVDYTSSSDWLAGEMFDVLTWLQMFVAELGLVLESKGEFKKRAQEQNA